MKRIINIFVSLVIFFLMSVVDTPLSYSDSQIDDFVKNADIYYKQKNYFIAINMYNRAIKINPNNIELYYKRASVLGKSKQYGGALRDLSLVLRKAKKQFPHAIRFRADCYMALGYMQKAAKGYLDFLKVLPKDGKVWSYLAEVYALMGRTDLSLKAIRRGLATGSHWEKRLKNLQREILSGTKIKPHTPFSN